jgi:isopentenyl phosphate kinase
MYLLAKEFRPERIVFCADVDGIFTSDPSLDPGARLMERVDRSALEALPRTSKVADVTGSIYAKVEFMLRLAELGQDTMVINGRAPGRLGAALRGEKVKGSAVIGGWR